MHNVRHTARHLSDDAPDVGWEIEPRSAGSDFDDLVHLRLRQQRYRHPDNVALNGLVAAEQFFETVGDTNQHEAQRCTAVGELFDGICETGTCDSIADAIEFVDDQQQVPSGEPSRQQRHIARTELDARKCRLTSVRQHVVRRGDCQQRFRQIARETTDNLLEIAVECAGISGDHVAAAARRRGHQVDKRGLAAAALAVQNDMSALVRNGLEDAPQFGFAPCQPFVTALWPCRRERVAQRVLPLLLTREAGGRGRAVRAEDRQVGLSAYCCRPVSRRVPAAAKDSSENTHASLAALQTWRWRGGGSPRRATISLP